MDTAPGLLGLGVVIGHLLVEGLSLDLVHGGGHVLTGQGCVHLLADHGSGGVGLDLASRRWSRTCWSCLWSRTC